MLRKKWVSTEYQGILSHKKVVRIYSWSLPYLNNGYYQILEVLGAIHVIHILLLHFCLGR